MRRLLLLSAFTLVAAPALAQGGNIHLNAPITFAAPAAITDYDPVSILLQVEPAADAKIVIKLQSRADASRTEEIVYPRDCQSPGVDAEGAPLPPVCPSRDTAAEIRTLIGQLNTVNLSTRSLYRRVMDNLCADFPARFPGCVVQ